MLWQQRIICAQNGSETVSQRELHFNIHNASNVRTSPVLVLLYLAAPLTVQSRSRCQHLSNPRYMSLCESAGGTLIMKLGPTLRDGSCSAVGLFRPAGRHTSPQRTPRGSKIGVPKGGRWGDVRLQLTNTQPDVNATVRAHPAHPSH